MPALEKPQWELYARNLAKGMAQVDAFENAGYPRNAGNASVLARKPIIKARVQELIEDREGALSNTRPKIQINDEGDIDPADIAVTQAWVIQQLMMNVTNAMDAGRHGDANKALEMLGSHLGMNFSPPKSGGQGEDPNKPAQGSQNISLMLQLADAFAGPDAQPAPKDVTPVPLTIEGFDADA